MEVKENENGTFDCYQSISYLLNGNYKTFEGEVSYMNQSSAASQIKIYGDEKLIYASPTLSGGMQSTPFSVTGLELTLVSYDNFTCNFSKFLENTSVLSA